MMNITAIQKKYALRKERTKLLFQIVDLPYIFIAGGFIGTVYEMILTLVTKGLLEDHSGSVLTPFNYIYGIGAVVMFLFLYGEENPAFIFVSGSILGGAVEFGLSLGEELFFGCSSWDYSGKLLNIGGRTSIPFMLVWGTLSLIAIKYVFPALLKQIHRIPEKTRKTGAVIIVCVMSVDAVVSASAVMRYSYRASGSEASNHILMLIDHIFDNSYMEEHFPHMLLK